MAGSRTRVQLGRATTLGASTTSNQLDGHGISTAALTSDTKPPFALLRSRPGPCSWWSCSQRPPGFGSRQVIHSPAVSHLPNILNALTLRSLPTFILKFHPRDLSRAVFAAPRIHRACVHSRAREVASQRKSLVEDFIPPRPGQALPFGHYLRGPRMHWL